jgi:hypothetical protein
MQCDRLRPHATPADRWLRHQLWLGPLLSREMLGDVTSSGKLMGIAPFEPVAYLTDARLEQGFEAGGEEFDCFQPTLIPPSVRTNT